MGEEGVGPDFGMDGIERPFLRGNHFDLLVDGTLKRDEDGVEILSDNSNYLGKKGDRHVVPKRPREIQRISGTKVLEIALQFLRGLGASPSFFSRASPIFSAGRNV